MDKGTSPGPGPELRWGTRREWTFKEQETGVPVKPSTPEASQSPALCLESGIGLELKKNLANRQKLKIVRKREGLNFRETRRPEEGK